MTTKKNIVCCRVHSTVLFPTHAFRHLCQMRCAVLTAVLLKIQDFLDVRPSLVFLDGLILKMKALRSLVMSVTTQQPYTAKHPTIPESSSLP